MPTTPTVPGNLKCCDPDKRWDWEACGCHPHNSVVGQTDIHYCPTHAAAPAMVAILRSIATIPRGNLRDGVDDVNTGHNASYRAMARALLASIDQTGA